jgi:hypothetical protein
MYSRTSSRFNATPFATPSAIRAVAEQICLAMVTTFPGASQLQLFAQQVEQGDIGRDRQGHRGAVDLERNGNGAGGSAAGRNGAGIHPCSFAWRAGEDTSKAPARRTIGRQAAYPCREAIGGAV